MALAALQSARRQSADDMRQAKVAERKKQIAAMSKSDKKKRENAKESAHLEELNQRDEAEAIGRAVIRAVNGQEPATDAELVQELAAAKQPPKSKSGTAADLEDAWRRFEAEQELDELRRRKG